MATGSAGSTVAVVSRPDILGGTPCVAGTRVPAATVLAYIKAGHTEQEILREYPTLPPDAVAAVRRWARETGQPDAA